MWSNLHLCACVLLDTCEIYLTSLTHRRPCAIGDVDSLGSLVGVEDYNDVFPRIAIGIVLKAESHHIL